MIPRFQNGKHQKKREQDLVNTAEAASISIMIANIRERERARYEPTLFILPLIIYELRQIMMSYIIKLFQMMKVQKSRISPQRIFKGPSEGRAR